MSKINTVDSIVRIKRLPEGGAMKFQSQKSISKNHSVKN